MPLYTTLGGVLGYGRFYLPPFDAVDLGSFSNWHTTNASSIAQTSIESCYNYLFDGSPSTILDGGYNMWSLGNFVSIEGHRRLPILYMEPFREELEPAIFSVSRIVGRKLDLLM